MLRKRSVAEKGALLEELVQKVWPKLESGAIRPTIYRVLPMERAQEAHAILGKRGKCGQSGAAGSPVKQKGPSRL